MRNKILKMNKVILIIVLCIMSQSIFSQNFNTEVKGVLKKWHKVTLNFEGKELSENDEDNPFLNYRLNVTFKNKNKIYVIPGFYAADGNASESSAKGGKVWQVRFSPDEAGLWTYEVSFRRGKNIAINNKPDAGVTSDFDGATGSFTVKDSDASGSNFQTKGRLKYADSRYLYYSETNKPFLKGGTDSPENFLGYYEFDQTPPSHRYEPHAKDWKKGDPTWQNGKGKNIIGALNYLASKGMNSVYFLTLNVLGDGKDVWPWINENEMTRFDCSKLDQWEVVFDHMDNLGLMLHIVTQETENELLLDIGQLGIQRKLYYRELIARFSHHLGVTWNLGEENGPIHFSPKGQDDKDRKAMARYIKENDPYKNMIVLHTHSHPEMQDKYLNPLLGNPYLDGISFQTHSIDSIHSITNKWISKSQNAGRNWVVSQDEIGPAGSGAKPDADDPTHDEIRHKVLWANLMAGGAGVEWYFGYKYGHNDLKCEDWRSRDILWEQTKHALDFFNNYLPFEDMQSADGLTDNEEDYVFAKNDAIYAVYLPKVKNTYINLFGSTNTFSVKWYNPRQGGKLLNGSIKTIKGGANAFIGLPPSNNMDWVALIKSKNKNKPSVKFEKEVTVLNAVTDFHFEKSQAGISYYKDYKNDALAIDASNKNNRNKFAIATAKFSKATGNYKVVFVTSAENDGESEYIVFKNGTPIDTILNPQISETFQAVRHELGAFRLTENDIIQVASKAVTNGKIPENDETAWSRGRWNSLILIPEGLSIKEQLKNVIPFEENNGLLEVEAEAFHYKSNNGTKRDWYIRSQESVISFAESKMEDHTKQASGNSYIEALPDTRITHDDNLIPGENFFPIAGVGGIVSYKIKIINPGKYYIWGKAFSSGTEDNGLHVGIDDNWPESGARMQWCDGKNEWTWSSAQRVPANHCGKPSTIYLNIDTPGEYIISFSMREDGFELDQWVMTKDPNFIPK
ncbi:Putative collagen-binding domain of a collagenase [Lutibacter agarilyticus]|uniref:Putative collagen-binding domain of a collagenase n=1 Tax=Lutibacter agarilyticus TaxID=1109740 RepID=A0A238Y3M6_9FLAO|nr:DUF5060 domain-containing protein [Lutibacter agarilyticus]SNR65815.1 Putative collagen-binding domain of a collagenase [Lutibacter agarilyticus]